MKARSKKSEGECEAEGWRRKPIKHCVTFVEGPGIMAADFQIEGVPLLRISCLSKREVRLDGCNYLDPMLVEKRWDHFRLRSGDLLISGSASTGLCSEVGEDASGAVPYTGIIIARPNLAVAVKEFVRWFFLSDSFLTQTKLSSTGSGIQHFGPSHLATMSMLVPPIERQHEIADFLDREAARMDGLIAAKERLLELLAEKRRSLVTRLVTRGLNPTAPLRDSGIPWLGFVPVHWLLFRGKYLWTEEVLPVRESDDVVTCFRNGEVTLRKNRREDGFMVAMKEIGYQGVRAGHLVVHSMDAFAGAIGVSDSEGKCTPEYIVCEPSRDDVFNPYFGLLLRTMAINGFIQAVCTAVRERAPRIHYSDLGNMVLPLPPLAEQHAIVERIATETAKLDRLRSVAERSMALLKERRSALISAAVTGKIDVSTAATAD